MAEYSALKEGQLIKATSGTVVVQGVVTAGPGGNLALRGEDGKLLIATTWLAEKGFRLKIEVDR